MAVLTGQAKIDQQAKVTAQANGIVSKSNDVIGTAEVFISQATPARDTTVRFGGPSDQEKSLTNISNKSALLTQKIALTRQINYNTEFITTFDDPTKSWNNDPAIVSARQQVQTSTLQLQNSRAKIDETLATIDGASTQIQETAAPAAPSQDTAQRDVVNNTSPATAAPTTLSMPELSKLVKNKSTPGGDRGVIPNVSDKTEPGTDNNKSPLATQGTLSGKPWTGPIPNPDSVNLNTVLPNVLHQYASYTYGLSLHLLTEKEYNLVVEKGEYTPKRVLIASAGRYNNTPGPTEFIRSPYFKEDFYFDGFELDTVIGLNAESRSTNAIKYNFTLIEPYGFTLIDRIINLCNSPEVNSNNYLDMPYLLQIDFFGIDDSGQITGAIPNTTKRIPIRLLKMDVKISARGAEYAIMGTPYNHSAFDLTYLSTPKIVEVEARNVAQFFQSDETQGDTTDTSKQRESAQAGLWVTSDRRIVGPDGQFVPVNTLNQSLLSIKTKRELGLFSSFGTALNNHQRSLVSDEKIQFPDKYFFNIIDPETGPKLSTSLFVTGDFSTPKNAGMVIINSGSGLAKDNNTRKGDLGRNTTSYSLDTRLFQINPGTYIDQVITWVIRNSKWMTDQITIPEETVNVETYLAEIAGKKNTPLYWFKIIPSIRLGPFDKIRKVFSKEITYNVQTYEVRNLKIPVGPGGTAGQAENPKPPVKSYDYLYTGKNNDILDLDIQFNALYYTALTTYRTSASKLAQLATAGEAEKDKNVDTNQVGIVQDPNAIMPMVMKSQIADTRSTTGSGALTAKQIAVADLEDSLLTLSQADMLHVKLKIIGDPSFIKQDDLFWSPKSNTQIGENKTNADDRLTPDGSLKMDNGEVYVNLTFRTPVDVDETTGLMQFKNKNILGPTQTSLFSGLYRVMTITNEFRNGMFTQLLNLIRLPRQDKLDYANNKPPTSDNRNILLGQTVQMNDYMQGPNFNTPDVPKSATVQSDETSQSAQQQLAGPDNVAPDIRSSEQDDLVETRALAPEESISGTTEPVTVPPAPVGGTRLADGSVLYNGPATGENSVRGVSVDGQQLPIGVSQNLASGVFQYKGVNLPPGSDDPVNMNKFVSAIDSGSTTVYSYEDPVSGRTLTRTFNGVKSTSN